MRVRSLAPFSKEAKKFARLISLLKLFSHSLGATARRQKKLVSPPPLPLFRGKTDDPRPVQSYGAFFISLHPLSLSLSPL